MENRGEKIEYIVVSIVIVLAVAASISQTILYAIKTPAERSFLFIHNYIEDYYYYLHLMRQGWEGNWLATSWMSAEVFPGAFVNVFFLLLGHAAKLINVSLPAMYLLSRVVGAGALIFFAYLLIARIFADSAIKRLTALLFVSFSTYWWGWENGQPSVVRLVHEWTELDPFFRMSFVPHHLWAKVFMLVSLFVFATTQKMTLKKCVVVGLLTAAIGFTNPVAYVTLVPTLLLWVLFCFERHSLAKLVPILTVVPVAALVAFYHRHIQQNIFPWTSYLRWEKVEYPIRVSDYLQALGPTVPLFLLALVWLWKRKSAGRLLIAWVASSWIGLFLVPYIPLSNSRYLGGYQFIPLAIGAVAGIWRLRYPVARAVMAMALLGYFSVGLLASWREHVGYVEQNKNSIQVYVPNDLTDAFRFIEKNTSKDSVIAAPYEISTMIPALTGRRVVAGHPMMTYQAQEKRADLEKILSGQVRKYNPSYLLVPTSHRLPYPVAFTNSSIVLYKFPN